jgi:hypothetical protein
MAVIKGISLMMKAVSISETSVNLYETTLRILPADNHKPSH